MRIFTFSPNPRTFAALQKRHAGLGESFFGLVISQEPIDRTQCKTLVRAMSEREYRALLHALAQKGNIGEPDRGLYFVGKSVNRIARGSGHILARKTMPPGKGFDKIVVEQSIRPLGSAAPGKDTQAKVPDDDSDLLDGWEQELAEPDPYAQAASQASAAYAAEAKGQPNPAAYAQAAQAAAPQATAEAAGQPAMDPHQRLAMAQRIAMQSASQTMVGGAPPGMTARQPGQQGGAISNDPYHPANRAAMAHQIGLQSTYASMANGGRMAAMMGFTPMPGQGAPAQQPGDGELNLDAIADQALDDLFG